ncbi:MAG: hypothetical protein CM15mP103_11580 [Gammaproteobacteria bacterium]|nr:MAG: hypothetical protein CM15mP103_11580 [Gammaproteobacteria bacterium]
MNKHAFAGLGRLSDSELMIDFFANFDAFHDSLRDYCLGAFWCFLAVFSVKARMFEVLTSTI